MWGSCYGVHLNNLAGYSFRNVKIGRMIGNQQDSQFNINMWCDLLFWSVNYYARVYLLCLSKQIQSRTNYVISIVTSFISGQLRDDILTLTVSCPMVAKQRSPTMPIWRADLDYVHSFTRLHFYWRMTVNSIDILPHV